jgi:DNA polymerase III sliding clamp (beta) subunit (PCNA family)
MITIQTKDFENAAKKCMKFIGKKTTLPVLANIKVEYKNHVCTMMATNLENFICVNVPCKADSDIAFVFSDTIAINKAIKFFGNEINFEISENKLIATSGNKSVKQDFIQAEEFPPMVWPEQMTDCVSSIVKGAEFDKLYHKCNHAISKDQARPMLMGLIFTPESIFTSDGFCATKMINGIIDAKFVISDGACKNFNLIDTGILHIGKKNGNAFYFFGDQDTAISGWLLEGIAPNVNQALPDQAAVHETYEVERKSMIDALQFAINMGANGNVKFSGNKILAGADENLIEVELKGDFGLIEFRFNPNILLDALSTQFETDTVDFEVWGANNMPFVVTGDPNDGLFICMPLHWG